MKEKSDNISARGFANMSKEKLKEVTRQGGLSTRSSASRHELTYGDRSKGGYNSSGNFKYRRKQAVEAGRKGGLATNKKNY